MKINVEKIAELIETPIIFINSQYEIKDYNNAAKKLVKESASLLEVIDEAYLPIFSNGIKNHFPFSVSEKRLLKKKVLKTTEDSFKLIVKPIEKNLFLIELIKMNSVTKTNSMLIRKNREFIKHSNILSDLIKIKSGGGTIDNISSDEIIKLYEEQLKLQFAIDDAVNKTIAPIIDGNLSISDAANLILTEIKNIISCKSGLIIAKKEIGYYIIDKFDDDGSLLSLPNLDTLENCTHLPIEPVFYNNVSDFDDFSQLSQCIRTFDNVMIIPLNAENIDYGFLILSNREDIFTEMHLKIGTRLGQLFSLTIQRSEYLKQLHDQANIDILTGCSNRRYGLMMLETIYEESNKTGKPFSVVFFDINNLKTVNDNLGHDYGDDLIKSFAKVTKKSIRETEVFARYGGDEFILIVPNCTIDAAKGIENRISREISLFNETNDKKFDVNVSMGSVEYNGSTYMTPEDIINKADALMYDNKKKYKESLRKKNENSTR